MEEVYWSKCDSIYSGEIDKEPSFKNNGTDVLTFFNDNILPLIYQNESNDEPPTSFKMTLLIDDNDEVKSITKIDYYFEELKTKILEILKKEDGWKSAELNGEKVCSEYYFNIACILWR